MPGGPCMTGLIYCMTGPEKLRAYPTAVENVLLPQDCLRHQAWFCLRRPDRLPRIAVANATARRRRGVRPLPQPQQSQNLGYLPARVFCVEQPVCRAGCRLLRTSSGGNEESSLESGKAQMRLHSAAVNGHTREADK
eukprot:4375093-Prymnesium_polylepis.1